MTEHIISEEGLLSIEVFDLDLYELGWNDFFEEQVASLGLEGVFPGRVARTASGSVELFTEKGEIEARISGRLKQRSSTGSELPGIGDWVLVKTMDSGNVVFLVLNRSSKISRKVPGKGTREQLIAANIDMIFVVMGMDHDLNIRRLERYLTMISGSGALPVVILNKADLVEDQDPRFDEVKGICGDVPLLLISALEGKGLETVRDLLGKGRTISLVGSSGSGKSTLINALLDRQVQRTEEVRRNDSKGRHVTTSRELFIIPGGGLIIDNPGIREIQLWGETADLDAAFPDICELSLDCKFKDCRHISEPGCAVKEAMEKGTLNQERYGNYQKMRKELEVLSIRSDKSSEAVERDRWKPIMKGFKNYYKFKKEGR